MIKTSFFTGIGTVIAQVSGIVVTKIIAVTLGTTGVAMISQFIDFITMSTSIATGGIQDGVVKYVAEYKQDKNQLAKILSNSLKITLISTTFFGLLIFIFSSSLSEKLFQTKQYAFILKIFSVNIILFGLNTLLIKILNGTGEIKKLVMVNISNSLFGLFVTTLAAYFYGLSGALISLSISQSIVFFLSLLFVTKSDWYEKSLFNQNFDKTNIKRLLAFTLMGICNMVLGPFVNIGIRNYIIENLSIHNAGIWSGLWKISNSYLGIITITISYYYLPKLSSLQDKVKIRQEIIQGQKILLPLLIIIMIIIFIFRDQIILLIYTSDFLEMRNLFFFQLVGDFLKIASFLVSYLMLAKAKTKMFIVTSVVFATFTYFFTVFMINIFGLQGAIYANAIKYFIYLITITYLLKDYVYAKK
jgi:PST family polysaccharide transporter